ncbi:glycoside hydrolase superfamily, partial [Emericellopsis atlantica]
MPVLDSNATAAKSADEDAFGASLFKRQALLCGPGDPCPDESCCGIEGICGYGPRFCGSGNCTSNCGATAMCGIYSENADWSCGMNLCCSATGWCGVSQPSNLSTTEGHCGNPDPNGQLPCQEDYGGCEIIPNPSCGVGSGTTAGRKVGYYQVSNVRNRLCNKVRPSQLKTEGFTHLFWSFARFDPQTFELQFEDASDVDIVDEFTGLQSRGLETWVAIGGYDFSDPGPTRTAWSDMASTSSNRAAFIASLISWMDKYGFQGADIDWEYPAAPKRGGERADTENLVHLVKEMRAAFGSKYGLSMALAPDYWYLRGFDAAAMESSLDFYGFMSYDLHGPWDSDVDTLGALVRGQTDIREIANNTKPLWFAGLDPAKINFGTAYYGRGYKLADASCTDLLCPFSGSSDPGPCTNFGGVLSLREIEGKIESEGITPKLLEDAMMKQIVWGDNWVGYDDEETIAMKVAWAEGQCFGGTMVWSIDFASDAEGSGDAPP